MLDARDELLQAKTTLHNIRIWGIDEMLVANERWVNGEHHLAVDRILNAERRKAIADFNSWKKANGYD